MDEPISFADLCAVDDLTLHFWPGGLEGALMQPKDSLRYLQESIAGSQLVDVVSEEVRNNFERGARRSCMGCWSTTCSASTVHANYELIGSTTRVSRLSRGSATGHKVYSACRCGALHA
jgi:hypothetical protein